MNSDVAETLLPFPGLEEINVYGAEIPNRGGEGRIGMAAIIVSEDFDFKQFAKHACQKLPSYARPYFLRVQREIAVTGTFKQVSPFLLLRA